VPHCSYLVRHLPFILGSKSTCLFGSSFLQSYWDSMRSSNVITIGKWWYLLSNVILGSSNYSYSKSVRICLIFQNNILHRYLKLYANLYFPGKSHQRNNSVVPSVFEENVKKYPNKICFYFEDQAWTFKQVGLNFQNLVRNI